MLVLAVTSIFQTFAQRHDLAGQTASGIFQQFGRVRIGLALGLVIVLGLWWIIRRSVMKTLVLVLILAAAGAGYYSMAYLTPQIEHLRVEGLTQSAEFRRLHGISMGVYLVETVILLGAGVLLPNIDKQAGV
jgi:glucan phosphoethanolaminetransferase (alkaline phosphatase superfamily)